MSQTGAGYDNCTFNILIMFIICGTYQGYSFFFFLNICRAVQWGAFGRQGLCLPPPPPDVVDPITLDYPAGVAVREAITKQFFI